MAIIIQNGLYGNRIKEQYMARANDFTQELKTLLVPSFEELMVLKIRRKCLGILISIVFDYRRLKSI